MHAVEKQRKMMVVLGQGHPRKKGEAAHFVLYNNLVQGILTWDGGKRPWEAGLEWVLDLTVG